MIPLRDDNPTRTTPYVMYVIVALNIFMFLLQLMGMLKNLTMIPYSVMNDVRVSLGTDQFGRLLADAQGKPIVNILPGVGPHPQWLTIFSSMFMHGGWMHIGSNMLYLWIFGNNIEDALGHFKFILFYLLCGVMAAFAHIWVSMSGIQPYIPTLGASGAIAGVLGAYMVLFPRTRVHTLVILGWFWDTVEIPAIYLLGVWFLLQLIPGMSMQVGGGVAYWAHIGGFVAGLVVILLVGRSRILRNRRPPERPWNEDRPYPFRPWK